MSAKTDPWQFICQRLVLTPVDRPDGGVAGT